jgi:tetratricopeptide (TPR) repeat protein
MTPPENFPASDSPLPHVSTQVVAAQAIGPAGAQPVDLQTPAPARRSMLRRWWAIGLLIVALPLAGYALFVWISRPALPEIPVIDFTGADPEVIEVITKAREDLVRSPRAIKTWGDLGILLHVHNFTKEATVCYEAAAKLDEKNPLWYYLHGLVLQMVPDHKAAIPYIERALVFIPDVMEARLRYADLLMEDGRLDEARAEYQKVLNSSSVKLSAALKDHAHFGLGRYAEIKGDYREALGYFLMVKDSPFARRHSANYRAGLYDHLGDREAAKRERALFASMPPDASWPDEIMARITPLRVGVDLRVQNVLVLAGEGKHREAITAMKEVVRKYPESPRVWDVYRSVLTMARDIEDAESAARMAVKLAPESARYQFGLGLLLSSQGKHAEAEAAYRKSIALQATSAESHHLLADSLEKQGDLLGALAEYDEALRRRPEKKEEWGRRPDRVRAWLGANASLCVDVCPRVLLR